MEEHVLQLLVFERPFSVIVCGGASKRNKSAIAISKYKP